MLSEGQIIKFQMLYKKRFNREIGREQAMESGIKLVRLMELIYQNMSEAEYKKLQKRRKETGDL